jgi:hypothetical protein
MELIFGILKYALSAVFIAKLWLRHKYDHGCPTDDFQKCTHGMIQVLPLHLHGEVPETPENPLRK